MSLVQGEYFGIEDIIALIFIALLRAKLGAQKLLNIGSSHQHFFECFIVLAEDLLNVFHRRLILLIILKST